jgi:hypothetical protein
MWIYLVCSSYCELIYKERLKAGSFGMVQENSMQFLLKHAAMVKKARKSRFKF